jgi:oxygen-dependent protoporphyrinogen oxidase
VLAHATACAGGSIKAIRERSANPPPAWDADLPKPKGQTVASFRRGLNTFPTALAARLGDRCKTGWRLTDVSRGEADGSPVYKLTYETPGGVRTIATRALVLTVPSHAAAPLLRLPAPETSAAVDRIYYPPVGAVTVTYPLSALRADRLVDGALVGFGQLHPRSQGIVTLGTIYSSALFPNRAPPGYVTLLNYIGGAKNTGIREQSEDELVAQVDKDLRAMLIKPDAPPAKKLGVRVWPQAIPQFNVGHLDELAAARRGLADRGWSGAFLGGNYVVGVALGRCVEGAYETAAEVAQWLESAAPVPVSR